MTHYGMKTKLFLLEQFDQEWAQFWSLVLSQSLLSVGWGYWPICHLSVVFVHACLNADDCPHVCPYQRALLRIYWLTQKVWHGERMRDALLKSWTELYKRRSHVTDISRPWGAQKSKQYANSWYKRYPCAVSNIYGGYLWWKIGSNLLAAFSKWVPQHTYTHAALGQGHGKVHNLRLKLCIDSGYKSDCMGNPRPYLRCSPKGRWSLNSRVAG